ncbi:hypothetical protein B0O80DRAFT_41507 [Mortierella sp. GBAus27b]|nr:hypothetical protein B0O80DRAFT_41507 [Mortierella sp. GBAus27b]
METPKDFRPSKYVKSLDLIAGAAEWGLPSAFFGETEPGLWLPEKFYAAGYTHIGRYLESLAILSRRKGLSLSVKTFCKELFEYLVSADGRAFLRNLANSHSRSIEDAVFQSQAILQALRSTNKSLDTQEPPSPTAIVQGESSEAATSAGPTITASEDDSCGVEEQDISMQETEDDVRHEVCEWLCGGSCVTCMFQDYKKTCIVRLRSGELSKRHIADVMAVIGVFAPFIPTPLMVEKFGHRILDELRQTHELPEIDIDDSAVVKAVRKRISGREEAAAEAIGAIDRKMRVMFEGLLETLPLEADKSSAEGDFVTRCVHPILTPFLKSSDCVSLQIYNKNSQSQKKQGLKPDRPDIVGSVRGHEVLYCEVSGPSQANFTIKNNWDLFRLSRLAKSSLHEGYELSPLIQVIYTEGTYMRMTVQSRGVYYLEKIGVFIVPAALTMIPSLLGTLPTLQAALVRFERSFYACARKPG